MGTISDCWHLKVNLKKKISLYVNSTTQRFFSIATGMVHLEMWYLREFLNKFETTLMDYSGAWGKIIHEKKPLLENLVALSLLWRKEEEKN
jgi:hypothetical protein